MPEPDRDDDPKKTADARKALAEAILAQRRLAALDRADALVAQAKEIAAR